MIATASLVLAWVMSGWYIIGFSLYPTAYVYFTGGLLVINWDNLWSIVPLECQIEIDRFTSPFFWWFMFKSNAGSALGIPVWLLVLLTGGPTLLIWRNRRADQLNICPKCDYDLTGLPQGRACPECGT